MISLIVTDMLLLLINYSYFDFGVLYYSIKYSIPWLGTLFLIGLVNEKSPEVDRKSKKNYSNHRTNNNSFIVNLLNPKNPLWLEILRYSVIVSSVLIFISAFFFLNIYFSNLFGFEFLLLIFSLIIAIVLAFLNLLFGMISLNLFFNVQSIRISLEKNDQL